MENEYVESRISRHLHSRAARAGIPLSGTFELTPCCNLACKMCYVRKPRAEVEAEGTVLEVEPQAGTKVKHQRHAHRR